jgi:hypothetical protein
MAVGILVALAGSLSADAVESLNDQHVRSWELSFSPHCFSGELAELNSAR